MKKRVIGITGGAGCGKSEVLKIMKEDYQADVILADEVAKELQKPGGKSYARIVDCFGKDIILKDGTIDRRKLSKIVFADSKRLDQLNQIVHPDVRIEIEKRIRESTNPLIVLEAALLIECGYRDLCTEFWYIHSKESIRRIRLKESRGYSQEKIDSVLKNQLSEEEFIKNCDRVIENNTSLEDLKKKIFENLNT